MPKNNIIELGFDVDKVQQQTNQVADQLQRILDLGNQIKSSKITFTEFGTGIGAFKKETDALLKTQNDLLKQSQQYTKTLQEQAKQQQASAKATQELEKAKQQELKTEQEVVKQIILEDKAEQEALKTKKAKNAEAERTQKQLEKESKLIEEAENDYIQLSKAYSAAALKAKNLVVILGDQHPVAQQAVKDAKAYYDILYRADQAVGQFGRNVGNYKSAFDGLGVSVQQIARELPSLAVSAQTFVLAISNNLPMLKDELSKAKAEIKALQDAGQPAPSLFERISKSIFSWGTALSVGITILTVFGKEIFSWIGSLFSADNALKAHEDQVQRTTDAYVRLHDAQKQFFDTTRSNVLTSTSALETQLELAKAENKDKKELLRLELEIARVRVASSQKQYEITGGQTKLGELHDQLLQATSDYESFIEIQNNALNAGGKSGLRDNGILSDEEYQSTLERKKQTIDLYKSQYDEQKQIVEQSVIDYRNYKAKELEYDKYVEEEKKKKAEETRRFRYEINKLLLEDELKLQETILNNSLVPVSARNAAAAQANAIRKQLINLDANFELGKEKISAAEIEKINTEKFIKLRDLNYQYSEDLYSILASRYKIQKEASDEEQKLLDEATAFFEADAKRRKEIAESTKPNFIGLAQEEITSIKNGLDAKLSLIATSKAKEEKILNEKYAAGKISEEKYQKELLEIQKKYAGEALKAQIDAAKAQLKLLEAQGLAGTKQADQLRQTIAEAEAAYAKLGATGSDKLGGLVKILTIVNDLTQKFGSLLVSASDIAYTKQRNQLQALEDQRQKNYEAELERVNNSTLSVEDKANRVKLLEAQRNAQKAQYDRQERQLALKKARFEKAANIANIITSTALAVVKALPNVYLAAIAGALGAAQLGIAIATPIPTYAEGLEDNKKAHYGIYGEAGAELIEKPGQKPFIADKATLDYLPVGTNITPIDHDTLNHAMQAAMIKKTAAILVAGNHMAKMQDSKQEQALDRHADKLLKGMNKGKTSVRVQTTSVLDLGWAKYLAKNVYGRDKL